MRRFLLGRRVKGRRERELSELLILKTCFESVGGCKVDAGVAALSLRVVFERTRCITR